MEKNVKYLFKNFFNDDGWGCLWGLKMCMIVCM